MRSGADGDFRMTIDDRYAQLAMLRSRAAKLFPGFVCFGGLKAAWQAIPYVSRHGEADVVSLAVLAGGLVALLLAWWAAGITSRRERFPAIIAFQVLTLGVLVHVRARDTLATAYIVCGTVNVRLLRTTAQRKPQPDDGQGTVHVHAPGQSSKHKIAVPAACGQLLGALRQCARDATAEAGAARCVTARSRSCAGKPRYGREGAAGC